MYKEFYDILFEPHEETCFATTVHDTAINKFHLDAQFFCINALKGSRSDRNVATYRNFLLEFDTGHLKDHLSWLRGLPISTAVSSGGKSTHFIVSLQDALYDETEYREVAARLHQLIPEADKSTKNPSRLSRVPGVIRANTGLEQKLLALHGRVPNVDLLARLPELTEDIIISQTKAEELNMRQFVQQAILNPDNAIQLLGVAGRNAFFYWLGQRLVDLGIEDKRAIVEQTYANLGSTKEFSLQEAYVAARVY